MLALSGISHVGLVALPSSGSVTVLAVVTGAFALAGNADTFQVRAPQSVGAYALTGFSAVLSQQLNTVVGVHALGGLSATFQVQALAPVGPYSLLGYPAIPSLILIFSPSGELMIPTWEGRSIAVSELNTMIVPAAPPSPAALIEYNTTMKPEKRTLEPGQ